MVARRNWFVTAIQAIRCVFPLDFKTVLYIHGTFWFYVSEFICVIVVIYMILPGPQGAAGTFQFLIEK